jgi:phosphoglycerate dehydrogenase-like enzyme
MTRPLVVVADTMDVTGESHELLERSGAEVRLGRQLADPVELSEDDLLTFVGDADAVLGGARERFTRRVLESCPRLRCVAKYGLGTDRIDDAAATELGIVVANTPIFEATRSVAEHALTMILALLRRIDSHDRRVRSGAWRIDGYADAAEDLTGKTVGIVGLGRIGRQLARLVTPFDVTILACDPYRDDAYAAEVGATLVPLEELLARSDVVTLHVPATPETRKLIGAEALARMRPGALLVNTCRGVVVDDGAVAEALAAGHLGGAGLDVLDPEPPPSGSPLLGLDRVILTPHVASWTERAGQAQMLAAAEAVLASLRGEAPEHVVNPDVLPHRRGLGESLL